TYFFFSSRRRHTRFSRDWSSDVCSSDLAERSQRHHQLRQPRHQHLVGQRRERAAEELDREPGDPRRELEREQEPRHVLGEHRQRSEERRVGKERTTRAKPYQTDKKKELK